MQKAIYNSSTSWDPMWQWSPDGRDFHKISSKDVANLQIKYLLNLEQCTEDHEYERIHKSEDNYYQNDSEYEETEYKLLLNDSNRPDSTHVKNQIPSENCEKTDCEKEENESRTEEKNSYECAEIEIFVKKNEDSKNQNSVSDCEKSYSEELNNELSCSQEAEAEKSEKECSEKKELREIKYEFEQNGKHRSDEEDTNTASNNRTNEDRKKYSKYGMEEEKTEIADMVELDDAVTDSGFCESFAIENAFKIDIDEATEIVNNTSDLSKTCSVTLEAENFENFVNDCGLKSLTEDGVPLIVDCDSRPSEELGKIENRAIVVVEACIVSMICPDSHEIMNVSESHQEEGKDAGKETDTNEHDEEEKDWLRCGVYSGEDLVALKREIQPLTFPYVSCSDTDWLEKQEKKWNNISNFTEKEKGPEIKNCIHCHGGSSGSSQGSSSSGGGDNCSKTSCHQGGCASLTGCSLSSGGGAGGGCAGSGGNGDDGDKWKKESFCQTGAKDKRKTKQAREMKKKSRLEKGDLTGHDSDPVVYYGNEEDLRKMCFNCEARAEDIRRNVTTSQYQSEGLILQQHEKLFLITENGFCEKQEWFVITDEALGPEDQCSSAAENSPIVRRGTAGKCYPCIDYNTKTEFCLKQIDLCNFYADEVLIPLNLDHPGVVKLYGVIFTSKKVFIMMELITGRTLHEFIEEREKLEYPIALWYAKELLEVLGYLYDEEVIHNDIKADNIMLREDHPSSIVLIDFGLAKKQPVVESSARPCGNLCGASQEKAARGSFDSRADVLAAIEVLVHMISGSMPWNIEQRSPSLEDVPDDVPTEVRSLINIGCTFDEKSQPLARDLLSHPAFQLSKYHQDDIDMIDQETADFVVQQLEEGDELIEQAELMIAIMEQYHQDNIDMIDQETTDFVVQQLEEGDELIEQAESMIATIEHIVTE